MPQGLFVFQKYGDPISNDSSTESMVAKAAYRIVMSREFDTIELRLSAEPERRR